ncbi:hypothetical protein D6D13_02021 [Aureobasidium pullulans]|uniref:Uncharacterized protein n=1 Tax=Aureobasidium pullulans TaxID=5580 RepID=A0A4S9D5Q2_AURPU|nr:hypothetical protein D6D13_02021 [Aureobasidium pullulans]
MSNSTLLLDAAQGCGEQHFGPASCDGSFDFTLLFEQTILSIVPSSIFLCCFPISLYKLYKLAPKFEASTFRAFKLVKLSTSRRLPYPDQSPHNHTVGIIDIMDDSSSHSNHRNNSSSMHWTHRFFRYVLLVSADTYSFNEAVFTHERLLAILSYL